MEVESMPVTVPIFYRDYDRLLSAGGFELKGIGCPR